MGLPMKPKSFLVSRFTIMGDSASWKHCKQYSYEVCHCCLSSETQNKLISPDSRAKENSKGPGYGQSASYLWYDELFAAAPPLFQCPITIWRVFELRYDLHINLCSADVKTRSLASNDLFQENNHNPICPDPPYRDLYWKPVQVSLTYLYGYKIWKNKNFAEYIIIRKKVCWGRLMWCKLL